MSVRVNLIKALKQGCKLGQVTTEAYAVIKQKISYSTIATNTTVGTTDSGYIFYVTTDALTITLPATVVGLTYTFVNAGGKDAAVAVKIAPNASDYITGCGLTAVDNKYIINTKATAKMGDSIRILGDGANGWYIQEMTGTWAKE